MLIHRLALEFARLAADEEASPKLACLHIEPTGHVTVSDGHLYLRANGKVDEPGLFDELLPHEERSARVAVTLPAYAASSFYAALKRKRKKAELPKSFAVSLDNDVIRLATADASVQRRVDVKASTEEYPNVKSILKDHVVVHDVVLNVALLLELLKTLKAVGASSVHLHFAASETAPVKVTANSLELGPIEGAVMAMRE